MNKERELILELLKCDILQIGNFKLKSGMFSPIYIDLRRIIHYPEVVKNLVVCIRAKQIGENVEIDSVCGVPYTAIPLASVFSVLYNIPMVMKRKEAKDYGTKKLIEGNFKTGDSCLLIEDIVCTGTSVMETLEALRKEGLNVNDCVVVVDKNQGGVDNLKKVGLNVHPLFNIESIFNIYCSINRVESNLIQKITSHLKENSHLPIYKDKTYSALSYTERAKISSHPVAKRLLQIMDEKETNVCLAVDTKYCHELIELTEQLGPHICLLKTHIDILSDFEENVLERLNKLSVLYNFLILEDRKFADIGNTIIQQYKYGMYKTEKWADLVTVHAIVGSNTIEALKSSSEIDKRGCVLVAEMAVDDALTNEHYQEKALQIANNHEDFVLGYVAKQRHLSGKNLICMHPGINSSSSDPLNHEYKSPEQVVTDGVDIVIVGKGTYKTANIITAVTDYKTRSYQAYLNRIS